jgi:hypothetical protein
MYYQYDGYPSGLGADIAKFLQPIDIVNGFSPGDESGIVANGMGCLAAQLIAHQKQGVGGVYIVHCNPGSDHWQDFEYHIYKKRVEVKNPKNLMFSGSWEDFRYFCEEDDS